MANMTEGFKNAILDHGATLITHIALVNESGTEIDGGSYARLTVTWSSASGASIQPTEDLIFEVPGGVTVAGWRGYNSDTLGTNYGGGTFAQSETFTNAGQLKLLAAETTIAISDVT